ncbi:MAG: hypothetical protein HYW49_03595 [Deltaproteobacteria bacterium]|nr:hypothetical protein [Deltaproteobacteria bacterium]
MGISTDTAKAAWDAVKDIYFFVGSSVAMVSGATSAIKTYKDIRRRPRVKILSASCRAFTYAPGTHMNANGPGIVVDYDAYVELESTGDETTISGATLTAIDRETEKTAKVLKGSISSPILEMSKESQGKLKTNDHKSVSFKFYERWPDQEFKHFIYTIEITLVKYRPLKSGVSVDFREGG